MLIGSYIPKLRMETIEEEFKRIKKHGFTSCQLGSWDFSVWTDENAEKIAELLKKYEITVSSFWCGWEGPRVWNFDQGYTTLGLLPEEWRDIRVKNLCDGADFANKIGIKQIVTHMGFIPENPHDPQLLPLCDAIRTVAEHLKANGQYLLFETGQETPLAMLRCFEIVGTDNLAVNLDTANLILYGKANPVDALDIIGKYVRDIHAKDGLYPTTSKWLGKMTPLGEGKVDFYALFRKLKELGYDSYVTIESELVGDGDEFAEEKNADILRSRDFLQKIIKEVYEEA